jgi:hypothetical protein
MENINGLYAYYLRKYYKIPVENMVDSYESVMRFGKFYNPKVLVQNEIPNKNTKSITYFNMKFIDNQEIKDVIMKHIEKKREELRRHEEERRRQEKEDPMAVVDRVVNLRDTPGKIGQQKKQRRVKTV